MAREINIDLTDKVVVITGGTKGLGREISLAAARKGAKIAVCSRSEDALNDLRNDLNEIYDDQTKFYLQAV
ncbi:MAG: SDR family NAD(P)-dependent oxidoreductase, partial [Bacillota bacterium]